MDTTHGTYPQPVYDSTTGAATNTPDVVYPTAGSAGSTSATAPSSSSVHPTASQKASQTAQNAKVQAANAAQTAKVQAQGVAEKVLNHPVVQGAQESVLGQVSALDKELGKHQFARDFEAKTHVPKAYTFLGLVATLFVTIFFNTFGLAPAVTNLLGYALPAYFSIQALESTGTTDDKQWLTYWISFSSFTLLESIFGKAIQKFIPWWFVLKTVLIVYLQLPGTRGAAQLYDHVLRPVLARGKQAKRDNFSPDSSAFSPNSTSAHYPAPVTSNDRVL